MKIAFQENSAHRTARAFTLVELLVVIAIIGVLVALLLPAIQAAREAARRSQCLSQIKQLALGCLNTHNSQKHFPTGGWGWTYVGDPDRGFGVKQPGGWIFNILPFIEQQQLHRFGADGDARNITAAQKSAAKQVLEQPITIINCPTRRPTNKWPISTSITYHNADNTAPRLAGRSDYAMNSGTYQCQAYGMPGVPSSGMPMVTTNYDPAESFTGWVENTLANHQELMDGVSFQRSRVTIAQVADGTSNTLMIGEKFIPFSHYETGQSNADNETWCTGWNDDNYRVVAAAPAALATYNVDVPLKDTDATIPAGVKRPEDRYGSNHAGVWVAAYCDGSTRAISFDADPEMLRRVASRQDGLALNPSGF